MKEILEEYGMVIISVAALGVLAGLLPRLKIAYNIAGEIFLTMIGG